MRAVVVLVMLGCGCGRIAFDARTDAGADGMEVPPSGVTYVKASNADANDFFDNVAMSASGTRFVVGAGRESSGSPGIDGDQADNSAPQAGALYVFDVIGGAWVQTAYLKASNPGAGDHFGYRNNLAMSRDGSTIVAGADTEDGPGDSLMDSGAVYVFARRNGTWFEEALLRASNAGIGDQFGCPGISGDGNTIVVGAPSENGNGTSPADDSMSQAGAAYVFERNAGTWTETAYLKAPAPVAGSSFGNVTTMSADGNTIGVCAQFYDLLGASSNTGAAFVYRRQGASWVNEANVMVPPDPDVDDAFCYSIALSADGNTLAIGAVSEDSGSLTNTADDTASESGAVFVYTRSNGTWSQQAYVKHQPMMSDSMGWHLTLSPDGNLLVVGSVGDGINREGEVKLFARTGTTWSYQRTLTMPNGEANDVFGSSVSMSDDGATFVVAARGEDSSSRGLGSDPTPNDATSSGAVYVFR